MSQITLDTIVCPSCGFEFGHYTFEEALQRGRFDHRLFWHYFLLRCIHDGQYEFVSNAEATINALACSNRYGKTTLLGGWHYHANIYKAGAEPRYLREDGTVDLDAFVRERYRTVHTAGEWDQAAEVWEDAQRLHNDSPRLQVFVKGLRRSNPPHLDFHNGARWMFRTLGDNGSGIDGKNFYRLSIDEAGWIKNLEEMMNNVLRVRVADVRGSIAIVGTFKPGISKDFFKICVRAAAYTGASLGFDHRSDTDESSGGLDAALIRYAKDFGLDLEAELKKQRELEAA